LGERISFRDQGVDPLFLVVIRSYLATLTLFAILGAIAPSRLRIDAHMFRAAAIVGVGGLLTNNFLYFEAINLTSVATALLLQYQAPVLVALYVLLIQRSGCQSGSAWPWPWPWRAAPWWCAPMTRRSCA